MRAELNTPLTTQQVETLIGQEYVLGQQYVYGPDNIAAERDRNYDYCRGIMNDLPAPASRSRVIDMVCSDYINMMLPNLLRIFTAGRTIGDYVSPKKELQDSVKLITRYINDVVLRKDNRGELMLHDWAKDALIQKVGFVMWYWEDSKVAAEEVQSGLNDIQMLGLSAQLELAKSTGEPTQEILEHTDHGDGTHSVKLRTWINTSKCCIDNIPPEEFVISRDARTLEEAVLRGHRTGVTVGELVAQGFSVDELNTLPAYIDPYPDRMQKYNSQTYVTDPSRSSSVDPYLRKVGLMRGILRCNYDGTGVKEWFIVAAGTAQSQKLLSIEPYNWQIGFADFCPEPMPHTVWGRCPGDRLSALQKICTVLVRQMNDNIFLNNAPQREVVKDWILHPDQLLNMAPGAPVLVKQPGAIREIAIPFTAEKALTALQYYHGLAEMASGVSKATAGLDPNALQNQSATAAANQYSAALGRVEMIARIWAQGGMRKLFRGIFNCVKAYQDFERVVQIDGEPQSINPAAWEALGDLEVNINTGLGTGNRERDYMALTALEASQKEILEKLGPNPIVDFNKLVRTLQLKAEAAGISYPENFFGDPKNPDGSDWVFQPPKPQPSPDTIVNAEALVRAEGVKAQASIHNNDVKVASEERVAIYKIQVDAIVAAEKAGIDTAEVMLRAKELELKDKEIDIKRRAA